MVTRTQIARRLETCQRKHRKLCEALADIGPIKRGSIYRTYSGCGSPGCHCHHDPEARHGPYWYWTCKVDGKSQCRKLAGHTLSLYRRYASNHKKLKEALKRIETVSDQILKCQVELAELEPQGRGRRSKGK
jgi:hypothetical protein